MTIDWQSNYAAVWRRGSQSLRAVQHPDWVEVEKLIGIEEQIESLFQYRFRAEHCIILRFKRN